jgi:hypothetical protein
MSEHVHDDQKSQFYPSRVILNLDEMKEEKWEESVVSWFLGFLFAGTESHWIIQWFSEKNDGSTAQDR